MDSQRPTSGRGVTHPPVGDPAHGAASPLIGWDVRIAALSCHIRERDELGLAAAIHRALEPRITGDFHVRLDLDPDTLRSNGLGSITRPNGRVLAPVLVRIRTAPVVEHSLQGAA
jgi:hypothetical protein